MRNRLFGLNSMPARLALAAFCLALALPARAETRVIEVLADNDSHFKVAGESKPIIVVKAGEPLVLRINARRGKTWNRDGTVHGFTLLRRRDHAKIPGWDLELKEGRQQFTINAPNEPGDYDIFCTVICSEDHEGMRIKFVVTP
jgi:heme/copper-type cytochrome/quinol oxidase subunit 2